jgi:hypothetical protein
MPTVKDGSWTDHSLAWIASQRSARPADTLKELERHCRKNYPFSVRRGWAYKAWLKAMRMYFSAAAASPPTAAIAERCPKTIDMFSN